MKNFKRHLSILLAIVMLLSVVAVSTLSAGADTNDPSHDDIFDDLPTVVTTSTEPSSSETEPSSSETEPSSSETEPSSSETEPSSSETEPSSSETEPSSSETVPSSAGTSDPSGEDEWDETSTTIPSESTSKNPVEELETPKLTSARITGKKKVTLDWEKIESAEKYIVFRASQGSASFKSIAVVDVATYVDKTAKGGAKYTYKIRAVYGEEYRDSNALTVSMMKFNARPKIKAKPAKKSVVVKLTKKVNYADGYEIRISTNKKFKKKLTTIKTVNSTAKKAKIKKLSSGKTYYVKVRAYKIINGKKVYGYWSKPVTKTKTK